MMDLHPAGSKTAPGEDAGSLGPNFHVGVPMQTGERVRSPRPRSLESI